jgi:hypothetical protein
LPNRFILISGAVICQTFVNVPFTTVLLSHGAGLMFLLWYLTPRHMFERAENRHSQVEPMIPRWKRSNALFSAFAVAVIWLALGYWLKASYIPNANFTIGPNVAGQKMLLLPPFTHGGKFSVATERPLLLEGSFRDGDDLSKLELYENDRRLGPADSSLEDISTLGRGRFSYTKNNGIIIIWSSSDNSDPNTNGRAYWVVRADP